MNTVDTTTTSTAANAKSESVNEFLAGTYKYTFVSIMIMAATAFGLSKIPGVAAFMESGIGFIIAMVLIFGSAAVNEKMVRTSKSNASRSFGFAFISMSFGLLAASSMAYASITAILTGLLGAGVLFLGLSIFGLKTKMDLTKYAGTVLIGSIVLLVIALIGVFLMPSPLLFMAISAALFLLIAVTTAMEMQMAIQLFHSLNGEDSEGLKMFAALNNMINFYMFFRMLMGNGGDDD